MKKLLLGVALVVVWMFGSNALALDQTLIPKGVFYTGDFLRTLTAGGLLYSFELESHWGATAEVIIGETSVDDGARPFVEDGELFLIANAGVLWGMPIRLGLTDSAWTGSLYTAAGPARVQAGDEVGWGGFIGGGLDVHTPLSWLGINFDVKNFIYSMPNPNGGDVNIDIDLTIGPAFRF
jgi:hypothetical protein